jgi:hypothetical protein
MEEIFTNIYETKHWGNNNIDGYSGSSGAGSTVDHNKDNYVPFLREFIRCHNITSIVDLGCGDFVCGKMIYDDLDIVYTGYDVYKKLTDYNSKLYEEPKYCFRHLDFFNHRENILTGDLCILKDVLQHWALDDIYSFLDYLVETKKFKYILICNCCNQIQENTDIQKGDWRPLCFSYLPLKKYNPIKVFEYNTKEVSVIRNAIF